MSILKENVPQVSKKNTVTDDNSVSDQESISTYGSVFSYKDAALSLSTGSDANGSSLKKKSTSPCHLLYKRPSPTDRQPPSLFKVKSTSENLVLNMRCGYAEKKNSSKSMEDCISVSPSLLNNNQCDDNEHDFSYCGVYDGHGGKYVAQYLKEHFGKRFNEQLQMNLNRDSCSSESVSVIDKKDTIRISLKETVCKIDREILLMDRSKINQTAQFRNHALQGYSASAASLAQPEVSNMDKSARKAARVGVTDDGCAGSCAVIAIMYRSTEVDKVTELTSNHSRLSPSSLQQHAKQNSSNSLLSMKSFPRMNSFTQRVKEKNKMMRRLSSANMSSMSNDDDYTALSNYDMDKDKTFDHRGLLAHNKALQNSSSHLSLISDLTASFKLFHRNESFMSMLSDDTPYTPQMSPKHCEILQAVRDETLDVSNFEIEEIHQLAVDLKERSAQYQKFADDCSSQAATLFQVVKEHCSQDGDDHSIGAIEDKKEESEEFSNEESTKSTISGVSVERDSDVSPLSPPTSVKVSLTPRTSPGGSSYGSLNSLKSFSDGDSVELGIPAARKTVKQRLATVTEGLGHQESRSTSFATSQYPSQESYISTRNESQATSSPTARWQRSQSHHDLNFPDTDMDFRESDCFILIAHVGDCRAVLSDKGVAIQLTEDHTPMSEEEVARIKAAGGFVSKKRVNGILAVSRAFGDIKYKDFDSSIPPPESWMDEETHGIWSKANIVISMPDILELCIQPTYEFIILATDGLWNVFTCTEAVLFVRGQLLEHGDAMMAAQALIAQAQKEGAVDNASAVVICLNQT